ncbi:MAG: MazG family protein [Eubacteriales bacterium]|nr:MazG family protein [Eubacteriales bacterium]
MDKKFNFQELHAIVSTLRGENGCPWDRAQTHETLKSNTLEEAYEVNQAINDLSETGNVGPLKEELGDLLLQIMLHSQIAEENGEFTLEDVIDGISRKMIHRHPHVFGGKKYDSIEEQKKDWEVLKAEEEGHQHASPKDELSEVPKAFPALLRGQKVMKKAMKHELISNDDETIFKDMLQSLVNLQISASKPEEISHFQQQLGQTLLSILRLAAKYRIDAGMSLNDEIEKFIREI